MTFYMLSGVNEKCLIGFNMNVCRCKKTQRWLICFGMLSFQMGNRDYNLMWAAQGLSEQVNP